MSATCGISARHPCSKQEGPRWGVIGVYGLVEEEMLLLTAAAHSHQTVVLGPNKATDERDDEDIDDADASGNIASSSFCKKRTVYKSFGN